MGHLVQPSCRSRLTYSRLHRTLSRRVLNISREGDSTTSLGSLFQCSVTLRGKKFFLMFRRNMDAMLLLVPIPACIVLVFYNSLEQRNEEGLVETQPCWQMGHGQMDMPKCGPLASQHHSILKCFVGECLSPANRHCQRERHVGNHTSFLDSGACVQPQDTCIFGCI